MMELHTLLSKTRHINNVNVKMMKGPTTSANEIIPAARVWAASNSNSLILWLVICCKFKRNGSWFSKVACSSVVETIFSSRARRKAVTDNEMILLGWPPPFSSFFTCWYTINLPATQSKYMTSKTMAISLTCMYKFHLSVEILLFNVNNEPYLHHLDFAIQWNGMEHIKTPWKNKC